MPWGFSARDVPLCAHGRQTQLWHLYKLGGLPSPLPVSGRCITGRDLGYETNRSALATHILWLELRTAPCRVSWACTSSPDLQLFSANLGAPPGFQKHLLSPPVAVLCSVSGLLTGTKLRVMYVMITTVWQNIWPEMKAGMTRMHFHWKGPTTEAKVPSLVTKLYQTCITKIIIQPSQLKTWVLFTVGIVASTVLAIDTNLSFCPWKIYIPNSRQCFPSKSEPRSNRW